jgi:acyl carrier protein
MSTFAAFSVSAFSSRPHERRLAALVEKRLDLPPGQVGLDTPISEVGDSLDWAELFAAIESTFGVRLAPERRAQVRTLGDLQDLLPWRWREWLDHGIEQGVRTALRQLPAGSVF